MLIIFSKEEINEKRIFDCKWGLVLAGGGGKGAYQIGAFKALNECGLDFNISSVAGASVGALNMCLFAQKRQDKSEKIWKTINPLKFLDTSPELLDGKEGICSRDGLLKIMKNDIDFEMIRNYKYPLLATVSNYGDDNNKKPIGEYLDIRTGTDDYIQSILLASSALPIIYEPVKIGGNIYRDGGIVDNYPIRPLYEMGIRKFITIALSTGKTVSKNKYPDAEFIQIVPSRDLGDLLTGTLDFTKYGSNIRMKMGYYDTVRTLKYLGTGQEDSAEFRNKMNTLAQIDYDNIMTQTKIENNQKKINSDMNKINNLISKYL